MKSIAQAVMKGNVILDVEERDFEMIVRRAVSFLVAHQLVPIQRRDDVEAALLARERQASTAIGRSVAVPHAYLDAFSEPVILILRLAHPINLDAPDGVATQFLFLLLGPPNTEKQHLDTLASIARLMSDDEFRYEAGAAEDRQELLAALERFTVRTTSPPAATEDQVPDGLRYTGRFGGGFLEDVRRRLPHYVSDFRDGMHSKCIGSTLFLFFACLAPAVTFGGVMAIETDGQIGAIEMIFASAAVGVLYALVAGQPLIILAGIGPVLIFTAILFRLCNDLQIPFLPTYWWTGIWTGLLVVLMGLTDASVLMKYFTRFTDETFSALISLIFIYEALKGLIHIFQDLDVKQHHDTALLSLLLSLGTFYIAINLSNFRRSKYLLPQVREFLADFGPIIAMGTMTAVAAWLHEVDLDVLPARDTFGTTTGRDWLVNPLEAPVWVWFASIVPAILAAVLVYLNQNITSRLVNAADHHLHKGEAYHLDLVVVGILIAACSLFGLPWLVAATVRSLNHLRSLATVEEVITHTGDRRDRVIHVRENRVTGLAIHVLMGLSLLLIPLLKMIPMAVLFGLFLFMGIVSMKGNQFFERLNLWPMDSSLYPSTHYIRKLPITTIHKFTAIQLACLVALWYVQSSQLGLLFPLFIALLVPVRFFIVGRMFPPAQLAVLDAEQEPEDEMLDWSN